MGDEVGFEDLSERDRALIIWARRNADYLRNLLAATEEVTKDTIKSQMDAAGVPERDIAAMKLGVEAHVAVVRGIVERSEQIFPDAPQIKKKRKEG